MAQITASMVKELREKLAQEWWTVKKSYLKQMEILKKQLTFWEKKDLQEQKKAGRLASEGIVETYIHGGKIAAIVEINSETDFVAKNEEFKNFAKDIAMQVVASNPKYVSRDKVPAEEVEKEKKY